MDSTPPRNQEPGRRRGRVAVVLVLTPTVVVLVGLVVWLVFFPPFSGM